MSIRRSLRHVLMATAIVPTLTFAQEAGAPVRHVISIGDYPRVDGIRLNFRDRKLDLVRGANVTIWSPYSGVGGTVKGLALGLPSTGAGEIRGIGLGVFGVAAEDGAHGLIVGGVGAGAGGDLSGISIGGIGLGAGGTVRGLALGGIGVGAGGGVRGIAVGGVGVGAGGSVTGIAIGGIGAGAGGNARGILIGGIGVGAGGEVHGIAIGGVGVGAGGGLRGIAIGGLGVGAPRIEGLAVGTMVRARRVNSIVIAPALFRSFEDADVRGVTVSAVNLVYGHQHGLAIGIVNYAHSFNGVQLGGINVIRDNPTGRRVLPVVNWGK